MKPDKDKALRERPHYSPFWICLILFLLLAGDYAFRMKNLLQQRAQLDQAYALQMQNAGGLAQARQLESRLEALSLELLEVAKTNATARQLVQEFNIQWHPNPAASAPEAAPLPAAGSPKK